MDVKFGFSVREEHELRMCGNRVLRRMFRRGGSMWWGGFTI